MEEIQEYLDKFYSKNKLEEAYRYLLEELKKAIESQRDDLILGILNELIGYYRVTAQFKQGQVMIEQALKIIESCGLYDSLHQATTYLNIATFYRVQGKYQESMTFYNQTEHIYQKLLHEQDERYISFYNNKSLLFQEMGEYQKALESELKALSLIQNLDDCKIEEAITYTNLSQIYFSIQQKDEGQKCLQEALFLFERFGKNDPHYFAALSSLAQSYYLEKRYQEAVDLYEDILIKIESVYGKNRDYDTVLKNKQIVEKEMKTIKGMELCRLYYEEYGKRMIDEKFSDIKKYMAIGLCGFGSDCLGYDDDISRDHDYGPGFCIWLPKKIYTQKGQVLQKAYQQLPQEFMGFQRNISLHGNHRIGVFCIDDFFLQILGKWPQSLEDWLFIDENALLACTNGCIFDDYYGEVTKIREYLHYYPEDIRIKKIARAIAKMAQSGQYNYLRCLKRNDQVAASLALNEFIDQSLSVTYLLNYQYKPYYKWSHYGLKDCHCLKDMQTDIQELLQCNHKEMMIEKICQKVILELNRQHLTSHYDDFLDNHTMNVMSHIQSDIIKNKHVMEG